MGDLRIKDGCLSPVDFIESPNYNQRPQNIDIDLLVIHSISLPPGEFGGQYIEDFFCNQLDVTKHPYFKTIAGLKVSAHVLIRRDGRMIQFVPFSKRAWHAGESAFEGKGDCNDYSIGIELEGCDDMPYNDSQYSALRDLTLVLMQHYPIAIDRIVGHSQIAPGRKTDPGPHFDWQQYFNLIKE